MSLVFADLTTAEGLKQLDAYFLGRTFVFGIGPSKADTDLVDLVKKCPDAAKYPNAARWWSYISGFSAKEQKGFKAYGLTVSSGSVGGASKAAEAEEDSDDDLFGDDDEEEEEDEEELAKLAAKKKAKKRPVLGRSQICFDIKPIDTEVDLEDLADEIKNLAIGELDEYVEKRKEIGDDRITAANTLEWGVGHEIVPIAFGIEKLQVSCCVIDDMIGTDDVVDILQEKFDEKIQSIDILAFNKANALK